MPLFFVVYSGGSYHVQYEWQHATHDLPKSKGVAHHSNIKRTIIFHHGGLLNSSPQNKCYEAKATMHASLRIKIMIICSNWQAKVLTL